uniref:SUN domain-containing protein n=1 Tax=Syphacia muris TaxID=451379 RepID=A0A0N5AMJ0_9BILA
MARSVKQRKRRQESGVVEMLFLIRYVILLFRGSLSLADFSNALTSSNTSPFYRFPYNTFASHSTCPLNSDQLNNESLEIRSCGLLLHDNSESKNISGFSNGSTLKKENVVNVPMPPASADLTPELLSKQTPIVTFDEWTKEKLRLEELKKNNQHRLPEKASQSDQKNHELPLVSSENIGDYKTTVQTLQPMSIEQQSTLRNYASKECGAKVLFSNAEAENRNAILNEKEADDYMRNPCERAQQKWVIFELCETIQPTKLEIANFELFSSSPKEFRILGSERYPSNDWISLGDFTAEDTRNIQRFQISSNHVYVKFIRLELLTHYGREHYCTLSLVRVFGVSIVDEYEAEAEAASASVAEPHKTTAAALPFPDSALPQVNEKITNDKKSVTSSSVSVVNEDGKKKQLHTSLNKELSSAKQKDRHIVDTVVDVMGNIAIANIKNVLESAFLRGWKKKTTCSKWQVVVFILISSMSIYWMCKSCPAANSPTINFLFCRAFFGVGIQCKKKSSNLGKRNKKVLETTELHQTNRDINELLDYSQYRNRITETQLKFFSAVLERTCPANQVIVGNLENVTVLANSSLFENPTLESAKSADFDKQISKKLRSEVNQALPGGVMSHKESVFLKLNKRINALELNMSLSSEYLSELSRRYVEKMNESEKQIDKTVKMAESVALNAVRDLRVDIESKLEKLSKDLMEVEKNVKFFTRNAFFLQSTLWGKTVALQDDRTPRSINEVPKPDFTKETNVLTPSSELLYSNDHLWTTEQLIFMVVVAQGSTVIVMLFIQFCYNKKSWNEMHHLQSMISDHIAKSHSDVAENGVMLPKRTNEKSSKRKRNKRRKLILQDNIDGVGSAAPLLLSSGNLCINNVDDDKSNIYFDCFEKDVDVDSVSNSCKGTASITNSENGKLPNDFEEKWKVVKQGSPLLLPSLSNLCIDDSSNSRKVNATRSECTIKSLPGESIKSDCVEMNLKPREKYMHQICHQKFVESPRWNLVMKRRRHRTAVNGFKQV